MNELKPQMSATMRALIANVTIGRSNGANKATYLNITLQDSTGSIEAKLWNAKDSQVETLVPGCVVDVKGDVIRYNEELQMKIEAIEVVSCEPSDQVMYVKQAPLDRDTMADLLLGYVAKLQDPTIAKIVTSLYEEHLDNLLLYPAASRNHHEYCSGLAYHTLSMCRIAEGILMVHDSLNSDLLYGGILLHDLGKVIELSGPIVPSYTLEGKLLGHISIGAMMVSQKAKELGLEGEKVTLLEHLVLSHHGKTEYGSPTLPLIKEAEVIYLIDNIDARIIMIDKALEGVEEGHFSKKVFPLENRMFYKPKS